MNTVYRLDQADVIVALDSDFLTSGPGCLRYAREFSRKRRVEGPESKMNRLYSVESTPTNTGGDGRPSPANEGFAISKASRARLPVSLA